MTLIDGLKSVGLPKGRGLLLLVGPDCLPTAYLPPEREPATGPRPAAAARAWQTLLNMSSKFPYTLHFPCLCDDVKLFLIVDYDLFHDYTQDMWFL
jgi:hypothetical protein